MIRILSLRRGVNNGGKKIKLERWEKEQDSKEYVNTEIVRVEFWRVKDSEEYLIKPIINSFFNLKTLKLATRVLKKSLNKMEKEGTLK